MNSQQSEPNNPPSAPPPLPPRGKWILGGFLFLLALTVYVSLYWKVSHYGP
ncbi:MAG: hypothetical protein HQL63_05235 [Magnetococcales bacterium]|nr:hypothetical protein [Magnetococcales bacterium]MBF0322492.1 hypothetical protein [Magnetococcales bacterium]